MRVPPFRAVVLAAGLGSRLRPLTRSLPKPLLPVSGTPVLGHTLSALVAAGCEKVAINLFHQGEKIEGMFGDSFEGMELVYSRERKLMGTLGALAALSDFLEPVEIAVVVNGDSLCRWPVRKLVRRHLKSGRAATLLAASRAPVEAFGGGIGIGSEKNIVSFAPGRDFGKVERRAVFAGLHVFDPETLGDLAHRPANFVPDHYEPLLERGETIGVIETSLPWFDLGTPAGYLIGACDRAQRRGRVKIAGRSWVSPQAEIGEQATIKRSSVEAGAKVLGGAQVERSVVLDDATINDRCKVRNAIIGERVDLPAGTVVEQRLVTRAQPDAPPREHDSVVGGLVYSPLGQAPSKSS